MDTDNSHGNGHRNGRIYVSFGPRPEQEMPIEWAAALLTELRLKNPRQWGQVFAQVMTADVTSATSDD